MIVEKPSVAVDPHQMSPQFKTDAETLELEDFTDDDEFPTFRILEDEEFSKRSPFALLETSTKQSSPMQSLALEGVSAELEIGKLSLDMIKPA